MQIQRGVIQQRPLRRIVQVGSDHDPNHWNIEKSHRRPDVPDGSEHDQSIFPEIIQEASLHGLDRSGQPDHPGLRIS